ncbi:MAG: hypothetical protein IPF72_14910 [Chitinophagaceae bacterium]|nr:hypothetical protein [Chitinophagaceae bacterium]
MNEIIKSSAVFDIPNLPAQTSTVTTFAVANAALGSTVFVSPTNALLGPLSIGSARVSSAGNVEVKFVNPGSAAFDQPSQTYFITVIR